MKYLTLQDILVIHALVLEESGGSDGVRDIHLLSSLIERPKTSFGGIETFPSVFDKTSVLFESLVKYHVFVDGNKRTAVAVSSRFLFINGYILTASDEDIVDFAVSVAEKHISLEDISFWFQKHTKAL